MITDSRGLSKQPPFQPDAKVLIIHADDLGLAYSVNVASFDAFERGCISSASVMTPCPWFPQVVEYARGQPAIDLGVHLTFTSEWRQYRWGPVSPRNAVSSLLDEFGFFHATVDRFLQRARISEIALEARAQIDRMYLAGIPPTHIDNHMHSLLADRRTLDLLWELGEQYRLPCAVPIESDRRGDRKVWLDVVAQISSPVRPDGWETHYMRIIESLKPGVSQLIVHLGFDDAEMRAITAGRDGWDAGWRHRDFICMGSQHFRDSLRENHIAVVSWRDLAIEAR